jgi:hypothetical protein
MSAQPAMNSRIPATAGATRASPWRASLWSRRLHKWLAWFVGVQALLWMASGLYMTAISIDTIHGDHLVTLDEAPLRPDGLVPVDDVLARAPGATGFRLKRWMGREVYEVRRSGGASLVDARTGRELTPLDEAGARALAVSLYAGNAPVRRAELLAISPAEVANRPAPIWRVEFADTRETTLYLSPSTGELLAKRHDLWRWFDVLWMLHIMDYDERSDVNNPLLRVASVLGLGFAIAGTWLLFYSFRRRRRA